MLGGGEPLSLHGLTGVASCERTPTALARLPKLITSFNTTLTRLHFPLLGSSRFFWSVLIDAYSDETPTTHNGKR